ncbi:unnamed protein product [Diatraea saccharalis]|uniref:Uncharacterized protein n=1 Tax=Diatraea saccharalis TaxID=40085 RepID=A0A9P0CE82_9NEOP|nr:unnamed protein product [Diatraea saccharalis]
MAAPLQPLQLLCLIALVASDPAPGRIPKVYNALITSNQNLEPSKAYPVYQPVIHDFAFPLQPAVFYGDYPIGNALQPPTVPRDPNNALPSAPQPPAQAPPQPEDAKPSSTENPPVSSESVPSGGNKPTPAPPLPPNTESPIHLNQFGLPSQVLPLGRIDPAYNGFNQVGPFTYSYPSFRLYDAYDPFSLNPFVNFPPVFRALPNLLEAQSPGIPQVAAKETVNPTGGPVTAAPQADQSPPSEPIDLNLLNYPSKDPAIPNVPPPPLPQGGLKSDNSE